MLFTNIIHCDKINGVNTVEKKYILKYPVLLVHGMGFRDNKYINYWGRIPEELEKMGCSIFYGEQDSNASVETNGEHLKKE